MPAPVWVVLPAYNEAANLERVVHAIAGALGPAALQLGMRVDEVPIVFREREHGRSNMSGRIDLEAAWLVPALRWRRWAADSGEVARVPMT